MKEQIFLRIYKRKSLSGLLFVTLFLFPVLSSAQGWSFSFQLAYQGDCGSPPSLPTFPNITFPTKPECESWRQYIASISFSGGTCTVFYTVSACTGSDMVVQGQINPGDVNF